MREKKIVWNFFLQFCLLRLSVIFKQKFKKQLQSAESEAINLAFEELLDEVVDQSEVAKQARELFAGPIPYTTHDLALSTAVWFYKSAEFTSELASAQMLARLTVLGWLKEGKVQPALVKSFENDLYNLYK